MTNPFDDEESRFQVIINHREEYSLWPATIPVPTGWSVVLPQDSRQACLGFVDAHWTALAAERIAPSTREQS